MIPQSGVGTFYGNSKNSSVPHLAYRCRSRLLTAQLLASAIGSKADNTATS